MFTRQREQWRIYLQKKAKLLDSISPLNYTFEHRDFYLFLLHAHTPNLLIGIEVLPYHKPQILFLILHSNFRQPWNVLPILQIQQLSLR